MLTRRLAIMILLLVAVYGCSKTQKVTPSGSLPGMPPGPGAAVSKPIEVTLGSIAKMSDDDLEDAISSQTLSKVNYDAPDEKARIASLSPGEKIVYLTTGLEGEVYNGGFHQYFCNTNGELAADTVEAYRNIGATKHADLMAKAIQLAAKEESLRKSINTSADPRKAFVSSYKQTKLSQLDDVFYELEKKEEPRPLRARYIRQHPGEFAKK